MSIEYHRRFVTSEKSLLRERQTREAQRSLSHSPTANPTNSVPNEFWRGISVISKVSRPFSLSPSLPFTHHDQTRLVTTMSKSTDEAPPPDIVPSLLSKDTSVPISSLPVQISVEDYTSKYPQNHLDAIVKNWRLSCYLSVAQIFLQKNALVDRKLEADDVKPR